MRTFVTHFCCLVFALASAATQVTFAEVIRLKNGDVIYADQVKETGNQVRYDIGDDTYTIPRAVVQNIDKAVPSGARTADLPAYTPAQHVGGEEHLLEQVIRDGQVNREALRTIESQGNSAQSAIAFYIVGKQEFQAAKYAEARHNFDVAMHYDPQNPAVLNFYAALLVKTGSPQEAISYAARAVRLAPDSADALAVLGFAQYGANRARDAVRNWKRSLALRPDASLQALIDRAQRETSAENNYSERETGHFVLSYEGAQSSDAFRGQMLATLEAQYAELERGFGVGPRNSIHVVLYTNQTFFDVTQAPSWTAALNDGKLRIPLRGLDSVTPDLARILKHELAHSFVKQLSLGRCPHWLHEGIAQMMEPRTLGARGRQLAELFKREQEMPLNSLESGFSSLSGGDAALAYDESLATVEYIRNTYTMSDVLRILDRLSRGESTESALRSTIHCDYRQLQAEVGASLLRQFGN